MGKSGGGGSSGAPPTAYEPMHTDIHAWILTGVKETPMLETETEDWGGITGLINDTLSTSIGGTPYGTVNLFDPTLSGNGYVELLSELDSVMDAIKALSVPSSAWAADATIVSEGIDSIWDATDLAAVVTVHRTQREAELGLNISRLNVSLSAINAVNTSSRAIGIALLERETDRAVNQFQKELELEHERMRRQLTVETATRIAALDENHYQMRLTALREMANINESYSGARKAYAEEELNMSIQDILWDLQLYDFADKALASIAGASVTSDGMKSSGGSSFLRGLSSVATVGSGLMQLPYGPYPAYGPTLVSV